jgi:DHA2 family methylenomycin A resistance protein-like MFS transporter
MNEDRQRITLLATSISYVLVILDTSIVNVALKDISRDLGADVTGLQWIVTAYVIIFASLVLSGGALGDLFGARKIYMIGLVLFTLASLVSGCAPSLSVLIAGRILQGVGASLLVPGALSLLSHAYPDNVARAKAIASWASWGSVALVLGPLVGGLLLAVFDWRSIFLVNVPICLAGLWLTLKIDGQASDPRSRRLDFPGQFCAALAMILLTAALIEGREAGWSNGWVHAAIALAVLSALAFVIIERNSKSPMLPLVVFANPVFSSVLLAVLLGSAAFFGMLFVLNLYFLQGAGYTPLQTGLAMMPLALLATTGNLTSARLAHVINPMGLMLAGAALRLAGFAGIAAASIGFSYPLIALPLLLTGLGAGLSNPMAISVLLSTVDKKHSGITSGISTATGQLGASIGVALFGAFLADPHRIADGTRIAATMSAALTTLIVLIVWLLWRQRECTGVDASETKHMTAEPGVVPRLPPSRWSWLQCSSRL